MTQPTTESEARTGETPAHHRRGFPLGIRWKLLIAFAGIIFNGVFDKFPGLRIGFMEAGTAWLLTCMERFTGSWESHVQHDPRGRFLQVDEAANMIAWLASKENSFTTAAVFDLSGGRATY